MQDERRAVDERAERCHVGAIEVIEALELRGALLCLFSRLARDLRLVLRECFAVATRRGPIVSSTDHLVDELPAAWERYSKKGLPLAILFIDPSKDNKALLAEAKAAAEQVKDGYVGIF